LGAPWKDRRPQVTWADRIVVNALALRLPPPHRLGLLVTPGTILRWHRRLITRRWTTTSSPRRPERPAIPTAPADPATTVVRRDRLGGPIHEDAQVA
jgi:hypothetical protein